METNEIKTVQHIAAEIKADVANQVKTVEEKLNADLQTVQKSVDAIAAEQKKAGFGSVKTETKNEFLAAVEAKAAQLKSRTYGEKVEFNLESKAAVNMTSAVAVGRTAQNAGFLAPLQAPTEVRDVLAGGSTGTDLITYVRETGYQGGATTVAEGGAKPKFSLTLESLSAPVKKIAVYFKVSEETTKDAAQFVSYVTARASDDLKREESAQLLYGDGTGANITGIYPLATAFNAGSTKIPVAQKIDVLRLAVAQIRKAKGQANAIMMNPSDVAAMELTKDSNGNYLMPTVFSGSLPAVGRVQIIEQDTIAEGTFLVGDFAKGAQIFDREGLSVRVYDQNEDDAIKNMVTIVIEERLAQAVYRPELFVKGTFATAITSLA